jgi:hypothetical protein
MKRSCIIPKKISLFIFLFFLVLDRYSQHKEGRLIVQKFHSPSIENKIDTHLEFLKSLKAIKIDWGHNEEFAHIPDTALQFSKKLETYRIKHFAEEYIGNHTNKFGGFEGRIFTELLPFFVTYLQFEKPIDAPQKQKSDILYNTAARILQLSQEEINRHHGS